jgi:hypothetical protein
LGKTIAAKLTTTHRLKMLDSLAAYDSLEDRRAATERRSPLVVWRGRRAVAAVGLYSLLAAAVKARRREVAIRQAIGATPARIRRTVVVQGAWLSGMGMAFGLAGGLAFGRLLGKVLYGVAHTTSTLWWASSFSL